MLAEWGQAYNYLLVFIALCSTKLLVGGDVGDLFHTEENL